MANFTKYGACSVVLALAATAWGESVTVEQPHCRGTLVIEPTQVEPGGVLTVGLLLEPDEHWHTYWQNPGDAGMATKIRWELPEGFEAGPIQWPTPQRFEAEGPIVTYGYDGPVLLMTDIAVPQTFTGGTITLAANVSWLVCDVDMCLPGFGKLAIEFSSAASESDPQIEKSFSQARSQLPKAPKRAEVTLREDVDSLVLWLSSIDATQIQALSFFSSQAGVVSHDPLQWGPDCEGLSVLLPLSKSDDSLPQRLTGVLVVDDASYAIDVPIVYAEE